MPYTTAIFDMDGTVLNTLDDLTDATNYALRQYGLPLQKPRDIRKHLGNGMRYLIEQSVPDKTEQSLTKKVLESFLPYYAEHCHDKTMPYPGINELLTALQKAHVKRALISNKGDFAVQSLVKLYFPKSFEIATGEKKGVRKKPYPDSIEAAIKQLHVKKSDCVYIGDSEVDFKTAENCGIDCILVDWGFRDRSFLKALNPQYLASSTEELYKIISGGPTLKANL